MMRHLPWHRLGAAAAIVLLLVLLSRYIASPAVQVASKQDHNDDSVMAPQDADIPGGAGGEGLNVRHAEGVASNQAASQKDKPFKELSADAPAGGDVSGKSRMQPGDARDVNKSERPEQDAPALPPKGRTPELADGVVPRSGPAVPKSQDDKVKPFEGLPLNVVVDIKASKPVVQEAVQSAGPPKEATVEQLKQYFEPDMTSKQFNATVLVVTPLRNARGHLQHYLDLLLSLSYPHHLISVALGEDSSIDGTYELATSLGKEKLANFRRVSVFHLDHVLYQGTDWSSVHAEGHQLERRGHLARARNELLSRALLDEEFVLWVDSDVGTWPADVVQHLLDVRVDIVAPACMYRSNEGRVDVYDRNTWRETPASLARQQQVGDDFLMLEGYGGQPRLYLPDLRSERKRLVTVDGVGGCVLLVRSVIHRRGLVFPSFVFRHHVETEGLAKMATAMGHQCYGMPFLEVYHL